MNDVCSGKGVPRNSKILITCQTEEIHEIPDIVQLSSAEGVVTSLPTTLLLWTAGATPTSDRNMGIRNSILPRDNMGHILTSSTQSSNNNGRKTKRSDLSIRVILGVVE